MTGTVSFYALLTLIALVAIPYGSAEPWWKAVFQCTVFLLAALTVVQRLIWSEQTSHDRSVILPAVALLIFAFIQTISWSHHTIAGVDNLPQTISADPAETWRFICQFAALVAAGWLLVLHTNSKKRLRVLIELVIVVGLCSAGFGLLRQATQQSVGFFLPYLRPRYGYAQFINRDHFVFMMEMVLGLSLGIVVCRGTNGSRRALYLIAAVPMWLALVLANSRGGIFSMLCQVLMLAWLLASNRIANLEEKESRGGTFLRRARAVVVRVVLIAVLFIAAIAGVIFVGGEPLSRKLNSITVELDPKVAQSYTLRLNIWQATKNLIKDNPVTGIGFGGYWIAITKYHQATGEVTPQQAHSEYLELLASGGLIGGAIGIWFLYSLIQTARRKISGADPYQRAVALGALTGVATVAIHSLVDYGLHVTVNALLLTVLISIILMNHQPSELSEA